LRLSKQRLRIVQDHLPGHVISQVSQRDQHSLPVFPRQTVRIAHGTHKRAVVVPTDRDRQQLPVLPEVNTLVVFDSLDNGLRHEWQIVGDGSNFRNIELRVPVEGKGVAVRVPDQLEFNKTFSKLSDFRVISVSPSGYTSSKCSAVSSHSANPTARQCSTTGPDSPWTSWKSLVKMHPTRLCQRNKNNDNHHIHVHIMQPHFNIPVSESPTAAITSMSPETNGKNRKYVFLSKLNFHQYNEM
jgi:hypothetical protein